MDIRERLLTIRLLEKMRVHPGYVQGLGIEAEEIRKEQPEPGKYRENGTFL